MNLVENRTEKNYQTNLLSQKPLVSVHARYYMILYKEKYSTKKTLNICSDPQKNGIDVAIILIKFHPLHKEIYNEIILYLVGVLGKPSRKKKV